MRNAFWLFTLALLIMLVFLPSYSKMQDLVEKNEEYEREIEALKETNQQLVEERQLLETDPEYLEKVAREKLGIGREGEVVYRMKLPAKEEERE